MPSAAGNHGVGRLKQAGRILPQGPVSGRHQILARGLRQHPKLDLGAGDVFGRATHRRLPQRPTTAMAASELAVGTIRERGEEGLADDIKHGGDHPE